MAQLQPLFGPEVEVGEVFVITKEDCIGDYKCKWQHQCETLVPDFKC